MFNNVKYIIVSISLFLSVLAFSCKEITNQKHIKEMCPKDVQILLQDSLLQIIDVRTPQEFAEGHIKSAKNINVQSATFTTDITALDKGKPVLVYCRSGKRGLKSANKLMKAGFTKIYNLEGGILKWKSEGFNVVK